MLGMTAPSKIRIRWAYVSVSTRSSFELPHKFDLTFDNCHTYSHCNVIWQDGDVGRVGVS
jgi:hypothetical protein